MQSTAFTHAFQSTTFTVRESSSGNGKRYKPSCATVRGLAKKSRVTIKNKDNL